MNKFFKIPEGKTVTITIIGPIEKLLQPMFVSKETLWKCKKPSKFQEAINKIYPFFKPCPICELEKQKQ